MYAKGREYKGQVYEQYMKRVLISVFRISKQFHGTVSCFFTNYCG
jgi:hypothetical protein